MDQAGTLYESGGERSLLKAPDLLVAAAQHLADGLAALARGDESMDAERVTLGTIDFPQLRDAVDAEVHRRIGNASGLPPRPSSRSPAKRRAAVPQVTLRAMFARDGWLCTYCGLRIVPGKVRASLVASCPIYLWWGRRDSDRHPALLALWGTHDHVDVRSGGGGDGLGNLVTACWMCQFGRGAAPLEALGLDDPRTRDPSPGSWDGLAPVAAALAQARRQAPDESSEPKGR